MIARFLSTNWLGLLVGALLTAALALVPTLLLNARLDAAQANLKTQKMLNVIMAERIETQNDAVLALEYAAAANRDVYLAGLKAAEKQAVRLEIKAADYLSMPTPTDPQEACRVADQILEGVTR
jgi:hypothetical protein